MTDGRRRIAFLAGLTAAILYEWFGTHWVMPRALRRVNEPLASRDAAFRLQEAAHLAGQSRLIGWRVTHGPLWLTIEGVKP